MSARAKDQLKIRAYQFSIETIKFAEELPSNKVALIVMDQLIRSATSIGANIVEAQAASSKKDFAKFFIIALKSANETIYWLNIVQDALLANKEKVTYLLQESTELAKILGASVITLRKETLSKSF